MADVTHQLISQRGVAPSGHAPYTVTARCGETATRRTSADPLPDGYSAWPSAVDCPACVTPSPAAAG